MIRPTDQGPQIHLRSLFRFARHPRGFRGTSFGRGLNSTAASGLAERQPAPRVPRQSLCHADV